MPVPVPRPDTRWRCTRCGNLTRFDVTRSTRVREFVHLDLSGEPRIDESEVLSETIEQVRCRWCDAVDSVELVRRADAEVRADVAVQEVQADLPGPVEDSFG